jgi:large subunit ribosomal protein L14
MIQKGSYLNVVDNSGARKVCCIGLSKGYRNRYAGIGEVVLVSVKKIRSKRKLTSKVKKGEIQKALIIRTRFGISSGFGRFHFLENSVVLLNSKNRIIGSRIFGCVPRLFFSNRFLRITSVCSGVSL